MSLTVGIDLGTTNSCIAFHDGRTADVISTAEGLRIMPSVIAFTEKGERLVGRPALTQSRSNPAHSFFNTKRLMGETFNPGEDYGHQTVCGTDGMIWFRGPDRNYSCPEMASFLISTMLDAAQHKLGERPKKAVITVPANFSDTARAATLEAGHLAGLEDVFLLKEPTAAAIAYGVTHSKFTRLAIYDLGGGTFDIALMDVGRGEHTTIETNGSRHLGGADFDQRIIEYAAQEWHKKQTDTDLSEDAMARVRDASEQAKIDLSSRETATVSVKYAATTARGHHHMNEQLTREQFDTMTSDLVERTMQTCQRALTAANRTRADIDEVILVGGMTRVPAVQKAVEEFFGKKPRKNAINPEEVVAIGAATQAAVRDNRVQFNLDDKTSFSFGIKAASGSFARVIPKGSSFPVSQAVLITTHVDDQDICTVHVYEGEEPLAEKNSRLTHMHVPVDVAPAGEATIELTFSLDTNSLLKVSGKIPGGESFPIYEGGSK